MKKLLLGIISVLLITGCSIEKIDANDRLAKADAVKFSKEYSNINISTNNPYRYKTAEEIIKVFEEGTGVIYFGFADCPWCQQVVPELTKAAKELKVGEIYYFDPKEIRDDNTVEYQKIVQLLDEYLTADENGQKKLYVPDVYFVSKGKIIGHHFKTVETQTDPEEQKLSDDEKTQLKNIYKKLMSETYHIDCDC